MKLKNAAAVIISLALLLPAVAGVAGADETVQELERVEVTGSRLAEEITDVPAPAYVVTREDIEKSGARSVQEALARVPGVNVTFYSSSMAQDKGVSVRGLASEVLLLVDGVPFMTSSYGTSVMGSPFDLRSVSLGSVERIEVVKGASSAIYGSNAAGGVINVITKKGAEKSSASIKAEGGGNGWFRGSVRGTAVTSDGLKATVGYARTQETGDVKLRKRPDGQYDYATDYKGNDYVIGISKGAWSFAGEFGDYDSKWQNTYNDDLATVYDNTQENRYARLSLVYADDANTGRIYYNMNEKKYSYFSDPRYVSRYEYDDSAMGASFNRKQELFGNPFVWGLDWRREHLETSGVYRSAGGDTHDTPSDLTRNGFAPYAEMSIPIGEANLDLGLRYEYWNVDGGENVNELVPRLSLNWQSPSGQMYYLTAGRFFAMPSFYQIFMPDRNYGLPNPDLKPESGWTWDIGVKDEGAKNPWRFGFFYMDMDDKIDYKSDPVTFFGQYVNLDEYRAWGFEGEVTFKLNDKWSYRQSAAYTNAEEKTAGSGNWTRSDLPRWDLGGELNYADGPWSFVLSAHWYADRRIAGDVYEADNILTADASVSWKRNGHTIRLTCVNIFDKEYVTDSQGYITPERRVTASWEYEF